MSWLIILQTSGALCCSFALHNKISKALSTMKQSLLLLVATLISTHAFQTGTIIADRSRAASGPLFSSTVAGEETAVKNDALLKRDRYVATNRFTVRQGRAAKFEKRWADRSSRLAELDGFRYFQLMRRVGLENEVNSGIDPLASTDPFGNYVSFTIWEEKKHFNAWRGGEAFKEVSCISPTAQYVDILLTSISSPCYSLPSLLLYITTEGSRWYFLICVRHNHGLKRPRPRGAPKTRLL